MHFLKISQSQVFDMKPFTELFQSQLILFINKLQNILKKILDQT